MKHSTRLLIGAVAALISCRESISPPVPQSLAFNTDAVALIADDSLAAGATVIMSDGSTGSSLAITYSSSNGAIATVDNKGLIHAVAAGTATIIAQAGSLRDELTVSVTWAPITKVAFSVREATMFLDDTLVAPLVVTNSRNRPARNASVTYTSSRPLVATVDPKGIIRNFGVGSTTITAREGALSDILEITVAPHFIELAAGGEHSCGITGTNVLYCWGYDTYGALGDGASAQDCGQPERCAVFPVQVTGGDQFVSSVTLGGFHTCALSVSRVAYCWGANHNGALGIGTMQTIATTPTRVVGGLRFASLSSGRFHTCGITVEGDTYCWGRDFYGQLGAGSTAMDRCDFAPTNYPCSRSPVKVVGNERFVQIAASENVTCGRTVANTIFCWGLGVGGGETTDCQFGQRSDCTRTPLLQVAGSTFVFFGMTGGGAKCGTKPELTIECWGSNSRHFGNGSGFPTVASAPVVAAGGRTFEYGSVIFGATHVCGLNTGLIECWGNGDVGQSGGTIGIHRDAPGQVGVEGVKFSKIVSSPVAFHSCGIATTGRSYCWGHGIVGKLGNGTMTSSAVPVLVKLVR